jgi:hypothetical protein
VAGKEKQSSARQQARYTICSVGIFCVAQYMGKKGYQKNILLLLPEMRKSIFVSIM